MGADILVTLLAACCTCAFICSFMFATMQTLAISAIWPQLIVLPTVGLVTIFLFREDMSHWYKELRGVSLTAQGSVSEADTGSAVGTEAGEHQVSLPGGGDEIIRL